MSQVTNSTTESKQSKPSLIQSLFDVFPSEMTEWRLIVLIGVVSSLAITLYDILTITFFLMRFDFDDVYFLPLAFILSGALGVIISYVFNFFQNRVGFNTLTIGTFVFGLFGSVTFFLAIEFFRESAWTYYYGFMLGTPVNTLFVLVFWGIYDRLFDGRQASRLQFGVKGIILFSVVIGLFIFAFGQGVLGFELHYILLTTCSTLLLIGIGALVVLFVRDDFVLKKGESRKARGLKQIKYDLVQIESANNPKSIFKDAYGRILVLFGFCSSLLYIFVEFSFLNIIDAFVRPYTDSIQSNPEYTLAEHNQIAGFLAVFHGTAIGVMLLIEIFLKDTITKKLGLKFSLLILPFWLAVISAFTLMIGYFAGYSLNTELKGFIWFFVGISLQKLFMRSHRESLEFAAFKSFFLPIDPALRLDMRTKVEGLVREFSKFMGGVILIGLVSFAYFEVIYVTIFTILIYVALIFVVRAMEKGYPNKLKSTLDEKKAGGGSSKSAQTLAGKILNNLTNPDLSEAAFLRHLNMLSILDPMMYREGILKLVVEGNMPIQNIGLQLAKTECILEVIPVLDKIINSENFLTMRNGQLILNTYQFLNTENRRREELEIDYINQLTYSKIAEERMFGALLGSYIKHRMSAEDKIELFNRLLSDKSFKVKYNAVLATMGDIDLLEMSLEKLSDARYTPAIFTAILKTSERADVLQFLEKKYTASRKLTRIQVRVIQIYGKIGLHKVLELEEKTSSEEVFTIKKDAAEKVGRAARLFKEAENKEKEMSNMQKQRSHQLLAKAEKKKVAIKKQRKEAQRLTEEAIKIYEKQGKKATSEREKAEWKSLADQVKEGQGGAHKNATTPPKNGDAQSSETSNSILAEVLTKLNSSDQKIILGVLNTIGLSDYDPTKEDKASLRKEVDEFANIMVWNMSAYLSLQKVPSSDTLKEAVQQEIESNYYTIFRLLSLLYDHKSVMLVQQNIVNENFEEAEYATELLGVFLDRANKNILMPLLSNIPYEDKLQQLQDIIPSSDTLEKESILKYLIQGNYKEVNQWTKSCAMLELVDENYDHIETLQNDVDFKEIIAAHLINPSVILREISAKIVHKFFFKEYQQYFEYDTRERYDLDEDLLKRLQASGLDDYPRLKVQMVRFLRQIPEFEQVSGHILTELAAISSLITYDASEKINIYQYTDLLDYFVIVEGSVSLKEGDQVVAQFGARSLVSYYHLVPEKKNLTLVADSECKLLKIEKGEFNEFLTYYEELAINTLNPVEPSQSIETSQPIPIEEDTTNSEIDSTDTELN